ncbi:MAG: hypothetical protein J6C98_08245 [Oscillospiraceae bacterium]|nr:hypothetical protein [Oscillospiraceae bacterium]
MKKLNRFWLRLPRKYRAAINLLATFWLLFGIYLLLECPAFTHEQKFRRMEKAEMVGPSYILTSVDHRAAGYDHLILAETAAGIVMFQSSDSPWDQGKLTYREKTGSVTVVTVPHMGYDLSDAQVIDMPVFVLHSYPGAVRAELDLEFGEGLDFYTEVHRTYGNETRITTYEKTWHLESDRELGGWFRFDLHAEPEGEMIRDQHFDIWHPLTSEGQALEVFSHLMETGDSYIYGSIPAVVRLYDAEGDLIAEEHRTIRSAAGERYARQEGLVP